MSLVEEVLSQETMRDQLRNVLTLETYQLIEHEYQHQWRRRNQDLRLAIAKVQDQLNSSAPDLKEAEKQLESIRNISDDVLKRSASTLNLQRLPRDLNKWIAGLVLEWNEEYSDRFDVKAEFVPANLPQSLVLESRPVVLKWIIRELLYNAGKAEGSVAKLRRSIRLHLQLSDDLHFCHITVSNSVRINKDVLALIKAGRPVVLTDRESKGIEIARREASALLNGRLELPADNDDRTNFRLVVPCVCV